jgi:hypothetical protein
MHKLLIFTAAAVIALTVPAVALAATERFDGGTEQGLSVTFDYGSKKITNFKAKVRCNGKKVSTFKYPSPIPVTSKGKFTVHQAGPSLDGKVKGDRASGTLTLPGCDASANSIDFIAHHE